jgi:ATP-dependent Lon protease
MPDQEQEPIEPEIVSPEDEAAKSRGLEVAAKYMPTRLFLLPVSDRPYFPAQAVPLLMNEDPWLETLKQVGEAPQQVVGLVLSHAEDPAHARTEDFAAMGTVVRVHNPMRAGGKIQFIAEGVQRFRILQWLSPEPPYEVLVEYPTEIRPPDPDRIKAYAMAIINALKELMSLNPLYSEELRMFLNRFSPNEPSVLTDFAASLTTAAKEDLQEVLEILNLCARMEKVLVLVKKELEVAKLQVKIREQVEETISGQQRKFFLREQLKAIQQELGIAKDDRTAEVDRFKARLEGLVLPEEAQKRVDDELDKLTILEVGSPEYSVTRNYLDWITVLPWGKYSKDKLDLKSARKVLDEDHDGLEDVKDRIIEFLAVGAMRGEIAGSILLLVGPPGVGKTSIGRSVARALGRQFFRFSLGGMRDEAEIKGHRRTYIGAMPGKFIQALKDVGTANPVIMLDEIDKVGASYQGDPASALLEVLDPEQNVDFLDHYLDVRFDLSKVLFMCTANQLDTIPSPLLDRTEIIRLGGYITEEKLAIAKHHLWPRQLEKAGLKRSQLKITDASLRRLIDGYAREAGVRNLEKQLGRIVRKAVVSVLSDKNKNWPLNVGVDQLESYLGKPFFSREKPLRGVGVVTGLAWTAMGGATLSIEATQVHGKGRGFKLTGQLGGVMKESAEIAYSYVSSHVKAFGGKEEFFDQAFLHLHVPEGATPKDGPSAGVTMATALLSLARGQRIKRPLAMTGELTLTGHVFPVGGIREKIIAARRAKIKEVLLPEANKADFDELPDHIREGIKAHFVSRFSEVVEIVFG